MLALCPCGRGARYRRGLRCLECIRAWARERREAHKSGRVQIIRTTKKTCRACRTEKDSEAFPVNWLRRDGRDSMCLACERERGAQRRHGKPRAAVLASSLYIEPTRVPPEVAAYAAGMIDGEGCVTLARFGGYFSTQLTMAQVDRIPLDWLRMHFGGSVHLGFRGNNRCRPAFKWVLSSRQVRRTLPAVLPYLIVKRRHAEIVLAWYAALPTYRDSRSAAIKFPLREPLASLYEEIRALNRRGPRPDPPPSP